MEYEKDNTVNSVKYSSLTLQGVLYREADLVAYCREKVSAEEDLSSQEKSIYNFILQWLDEKDYVEVFTSGSTGEPKKTKLYKEHMINSALKTGKYLNLKPNETALLCLPAGYIAGKMMIVRSMVLGLNLIFSDPSSKPLEGLTLQPDFTALVPLQMANILQDPLQKKILAKIKNVLVGGGRLDEQICDELESLPNAIYESYGMTETSSHVALKRINGIGRQTGFQTMEGVGISADRRNCLQIEAPELSHDLIITNDIVEIINDHEFKHIGRYDSIINSGGIKHIPELIEQKIKALIREPFIIAAETDKTLGEQLILIIESKVKSREELNKLKQTMQEVLEKYEVPRKIYFTSSFEYTPTGKIKRENVLQSLKLAE